MRPKTACVAVAACLLALVAVPGRADEKPKQKEKEKELTVMQRKLLHSQKVLEGLAMSDFAKIGAGADGLAECAKDVTWKLNETEKYVAYTTDFLRRAESLKKAAKDKNLDAAALSYVDMTLTCVKCHQYLRQNVGLQIPDAVFAQPKK